MLCINASESKREWKKGGVLSSLSGKLRKAICSVVRARGLSTTVLWYEALTWVVLCMHSKLATAAETWFTAAGALGPGLRDVLTAPSKSCGQSGKSRHQRARHTPCVFAANLGPFFTHIQLFTENGHLEQRLFTVLVNTAN